MNDIEVLIAKRSNNKKRPTHVTSQRERLVPAIHTRKELSDYGLSGNVSFIDIEDLGKRIEANLIVILDEDIYIPEDFINKVVSFNNMFRDAGVLCGPVFPTLDSPFSKSYYTYDLKFGTSVVSDITKEENSFPSILGSVITGQAYNRYLYTPVKSSRHVSADNAFFMSTLCKEYKIYYSPKLLKARYLEKSDLEIDCITSYYYNLGYQDGLAVSSKNKDDKNMELFNRFVNSPEMFDNTMPRWLFESSPAAESEYLEILVLAKCKYQIGFYEGMLGKEVI